MATLANQCPHGNTQEELDDPAALVIHGPTWADAQPWDEAARDLHDELLRWNFKPLRRGALLHMLPSVLAEA